MTETARLDIVIGTGNAVTEAKKLDAALDRIAARARATQAELTKVGSQMGGTGAIQKIRNEVTALQAQIGRLGTQKIDILGGAGDQIRQAQAGVAALRRQLDGLNTSKQAPKGSSNTKSAGSPIDADATVKSIARIEDALERLAKKAADTQRVLSGLGGTPMAGGMTKVLQAELRQLQRMVDRLNSSRPVNLLPGAAASVSKAQASIAALQRQINNLSGKAITVTTTHKTVGGSAGGIGANIDAMASGGVAKVTAAAAAVATAAATISAAMKGIVSANVEVQKLKASLETVTGSAAAASLAFKTIEKFATETPYDLAQVVEAFIKLKALGLDATEDSLRSFGNTASSMGKPMMQMIEAVADAATGEFERLKEFGITASKEGDKVKFTFQGITKTVANESRAIQQYLMDIGNVQFAGAMERQMQTLGGKMANLTDQVNKLSRQIGEGGLNSALSALIDNMTKATASSDSFGTKLGQLSGAIINDAAQFVTELSSQIDAYNDLWDKVTTGRANTNTSVTVPVIDRTTEGLDPKDLDNLTGVTRKPPEENPGLFIQSKDGKAQLQPNNLAFGRSSQKSWDDLQREAEDRKSGKRPTMTIGQQFAADKKALVEQITLLDHMNEAFKRGRGSVEQYRNSQSDLSNVQQLSAQYGKKQAEELSGLQAELKGMEEIKAFKEATLGMRENIQQTEELTEAYGKGSAAVRDVEAAQRAYDKAVELGMSGRSSVVQELTELEQQAQKSNAALATTQRLSEMKTEASGLEKMIAAFQLGSDAIDDATASIEAYQMALADGSEGEEEKVKELEEWIKKLREMQAVLNQLRNVRDQKIQIEVEQKVLGANRNLFGEERLNAITRADIEGQQQQAGLDPNSPTSIAEADNAVKLAELQRQSDMANDSLKRLGETGVNFQQVMRDAAAGGLMELGDALTDIVTGSASAKEAFANMAKNIAKMLAQMAIQMMIIGPLARMMGVPMFHGGGIVGGPSQMRQFHTGGIVGNGGMPRAIPKFHSGGIVGSLSSVAHLPRFHTGGLAGNEELAVLQKGEGVFTREQMAAMAPVGGGGGGGSVSNNFNISVNQPPGASQQQGEAFGKAIARQVKDMVNSELNQQMRNGGTLNPHGYNR